MSASVGSIVLQKWKVAGLRIFRENTTRAAIANLYNLNRVTEVASVSFARADEVPHIFTRNARLQPAEFLIIGAKRLLQHNLPRATIRTRSKAARYSITSSARPCIVAGTVRSSARAVFVLTASSNLVGA